MDDAPLLPAKGSEKTHEGEESSVWSEVTKQMYLAGPLVAGFFLLNVVQVISLMFFGHLGKVEFAGASVATAFSSVTGFSLLVNEQPLWSYRTDSTADLFVTDRTRILCGRQAWLAAWRR